MQWQTCRARGSGSSKQPLLYMPWAERIICCNAAVPRGVSPPLHRLRQWTSTNKCKRTQIQRCRIQHDGAVLQTVRGDVALESWTGNIEVAEWDDVPKSRVARHRSTHEGLPSFLKIFYDTQADYSPCFFTLPLLVSTLLWPSV